jgi:hypothetical protein
VRERENFDEAVYGGSGTVVFRGFQRYIEPLKTTRRERTEKDKARYLPKNTSGAEKKIIICGKKKFKVIQNLCSDTMLKERLYIESQSIMYRRGLFI